MEISNNGFISLDVFMTPSSADGEELPTRLIQNHFLFLSHIMYI